MYPTYVPYCPYRYGGVTRVLKSYKGTHTHTHTHTHTLTQYYTHLLSGLSTGQSPTERRRRSLWPGRWKQLGRLCPYEESLPLYCVDTTNNWLTRYNNDPVFFSPIAVAKFTQWGSQLLSYIHSDLHLQVEGYAGVEGGRGRERERERERCV